MSKSLLLLLAALLSGFRLGRGHGSRFDGSGSSWRGRGGGGWRGDHHHHPHLGDDDPYRILQVPRGSSAEEIRRAYRSRCLSDHPDKTLHLSPAERRRREDRFKRVQRAYAAIGDPDQRRLHDALHAPRASSPFSSSQAGAGASPSPFEEDDMLRFYFPFAAAAFGPSPFGWAPGGGRFGSFRDGPYYPRHPSHGSRRGRPVTRRKRTGLFGRPAPPSVFVQRVAVPLEELYRGGVVRKVRLDDAAGTWWGRIAAAFRGGVVPWITYQAVLYSLPLAHFSAVAALGCGLYVFYQLLPAVESTSDEEEEDNLRAYGSTSGACRTGKLYSLKIEPGYKGGTKFTYAEENANAHVVFVLEESPHGLYRRVGNDLHAAVAVTAEQAREGCVVPLPSLDPTQPDISVRIPAGLVRQPREATHGENAVASSNTMIVLEGQGWPIRQRTAAGGSSRRTQPSRKKGDLVVHVFVDPVSRPKRSRRHR
jgi:DnaJ-class molecular chaperone